VDVTVPVPEPGAHDLLVRIRAVSVNPVDTKIRRGSPVAAGEARILGFDAAATVEATGAQVTRFGVADEASDPSRAQRRLQLVWAPVADGRYRAQAPRLGRPSQQLRSTTRKCLLTTAFDGRGWFRTTVLSRVKHGVCGGHGITACTLISTSSSPGSGRSTSSCRSTLTSPVACMVTGLDEDIDQIVLANGVRSRRGYLQNRTEVFEAREETLGASRWGERGRELGARVDRELAVDARQVDFDRPLGDEERLSDLAVRGSFGCHLGDAPLAGGE
jgi:Alcohol dehydrogenase GroES-like domain